MATFSTNQFRHIYVATSDANVTVDSSAPNAEGKLNLVTKRVDGNSNDVPVTPYFEYYGKGGLIRSDLLENISYVKVTNSTALGEKGKKSTITVDTGVTPVVGQDYIVNVIIRQFGGISDESVMIKTAAARATSTTAADLYLALAKSLYRAFKRDEPKLLKVSVLHSTTATEVTDANLDTLTTSNADNGIVIEPVEQDWVLGTLAQENVYYDITFSATSNNEPWGKVVEANTTADIVDGGKKLADLEYFLMGERGDVYRNVNWPNSIRTQYMVDATKGYDIVDIHYAYQGTCEDIQKSEKDVIILIPQGTKGTPGSKAALIAAALTPLDKTWVDGAIATAVAEIGD